MNQSLKMPMMFQELYALLNSRMTIGAESLAMHGISLFSQHESSLSAQESNRLDCVLQT